MNDFESLNQSEMECDDFFGFGVFADPKEPKKPIAEPQIKKEEIRVEAPKVLLMKEEETVVREAPKPSEPPIDMAMSWMEISRTEDQEPGESAIDRVTPRIELPHTEAVEPKKRATKREKTPFEQFLDAPGGRWINGLVWGLLAFLLAEGLTHLFGARAYYSLIYKCFVFPILSAVGAGLFYMFNRETDSVIERNVVTAIEVTALVVTLQGIVRLLWI